MAWIDDDDEHMGKSWVDVKMMKNSIKAGKSNTRKPTWKSLILLVPMRLGAEKLNSIYRPCLTGLLTLDNCIGIIGGRPNHSLYFVGFQGEGTTYTF
jgi:hypothetical protein